MRFQLALDEFVNTRGLASVHVQRSIVALTALSNKTKTKTKTKTQSKTVLTFTRQMSRKAVILCAGFAGFIVHACGAPPPAPNVDRLFGKERGARPARHRQIRGGDRNRRRRALRRLCADGGNDPR